MHYGKFIKEIRKSKGMTQIQLSRLSGYSQTFLCQAETGARYKFSDKAMQKICSVFEISPAYILVRVAEEEMKKHNLSEQQQSHLKSSFTYLANLIKDSVIKPPKSHSVCCEQIKLEVLPMINSAQLLASH